MFTRYKKSDINSIEDILDIDLYNEVSLINDKFIVIKKLFCEVDTEDYKIAEDLTYDCLARLKKGEKFVNMSTRLLSISAYYDEEDNLMIDYNFRLM